MRFGALRRVRWLDERQIDSETLFVEIKLVFGRGKLERGFMQDLLVRSANQKFWIGIESSGLGGGDLKRV